MSLNLIAGSLETAYLSILRELRETLEMLLDINQTFMQIKLSYGPLPIGCVVDSLSQ